MDIYYLKDHMFEEFDGAKEYLKQAISLKNVNNEWSKMFYEMGKAELDHATMFYKMLDQHYRQISIKPDLASYMEPFKNDIDECYIEKAGRIKYLMETYTK